MVQIAEQELFYSYRRGPVDAPAVVLIHGAGGTHLDWPAPIRRLPAAHIYALDLPGHGRSAPPGRERIEAYADVVEAFIAHLKVEKVILVGHSMGGAIVQTLGLRRLRPLQGLVLLATGARLPVNATLLEKPAAEFGTVVDFVMRYAWHPDTPEEMVTIARARLQDNDPVTMREDFIACDRFDLRRAVHAITLPTLVVGGSEDRMTPLKFSQYLAAEIPDARLVTVKGGGHMVALEQPDVVAAAIAAFCERIGTQG